jgi:hypothetical protein
MSARLGVEVLKQFAAYRQSSPFISGVHFKYGTHAQRGGGVCRLEVVTTGNVSGMMGHGKKEIKEAPH